MATDSMDRRHFLRRAEELAAGALCSARGVRVLLPVLTGTSALAAGCAGARFVAAAHDLGPAGPRLVVRRADLGPLAPGAGVLIQHPAAELPIYLRREDDADAAVGSLPNGATDSARNGHAPGLAGERYTAVWTRCMHRGCQVEPEGDRLVCPCHGSEYTFAGAVLQGPTERPLDRYRVTADADNVYIHLAPGGGR